MESDRPDEVPTGDSNGITPEMMTFVSKVPAITLGFWIIKILCTTIGETGGDAFTMSFLGETTDAATGYGYLYGTALFAVVFLIAVAIQIKASKFHPFLYWFTIVATTTVGTTLADYLTRSNGLGYALGSAILLSCVVVTLLVWRLATGTIAIASVRTPRSESFYWLTIMFSQTLGTALGDYVASDDGLNLGYLVSAAVFGGALVILLLLYFATPISRTLLFWIAFIVTRPLGAVVGDFLDKPTEDGGLDLSRYLASGILLVVIVLCILIFPKKPAEEAH